MPAIENEKRDMTTVSSPCREGKKQGVMPADETPVSIVVPAYNEERGIGEYLTDLQKALQGADMEYEVIVVNDGSEDGTAEEVRKLSGIRLAEHERNRGYGAALMTGISNAMGDIIVITDADGTYPPEHIADLVSDVRKGADMAVGARTGESVAIPAMRRPAKWVLKKLAGYLAERSIPDLNSGLRAFRKESVLRFFAILPSGFSFTTTITLAMLCNNLEVTYRPIDYLPRTGSSKIRPFRDTYNFVTLILRTICYFNPLKVFVPPALIVGAVGMVKLVHGIFWERNISQGEEIALLAAAQMLGIGVVADMVAKLIVREPRE